MKFNIFKFTFKSLLLISAFLLFILGLILALKFHSEISILFIASACILFIADNF